MFARKAASGVAVFLQYGIEQTSPAQAVLAATFRSSDPALIQEAVRLWQDKVGACIASL
jgi:hypothetical protein